MLKKIFIFILEIVSESSRDMHIRDKAQQHARKRLSLSGKRNFLAAQPTNEDFNAVEEDNLFS